MRLNDSKAMALFAAHGIQVGADSIPSNSAYTLGFIFDDTRGAIIAHAGLLANEGNIRETIDPLIGMHAYQARALASALDLPSTVWARFSAFCLHLYALYTQLDAVILTVTLLAITEENGIIAYGGSIEIDDDALWRQPSFAAAHTPSSHASDLTIVPGGLPFSPFDGTVALICNGAGMMMASADCLSTHQLKPVTAIEIDGEPSLTRLRAAFNQAQPGADAILVSLFCERFSAHSVVDHLIVLAAELPSDTILFTRLAGIDAPPARARLIAVGIPCVSTLSAAAIGLRELVKRIPEVEDKSKEREKD
ncbi:MAG: hypothetical protein SGJ24_06555 [Chloroflexota bacterium]|nr:hypothetical protein [Chloroflexota bacterium]